jgi:hypothetical protein
VNEYGLTLVARLSHSDTLDIAVRELAERFETMWSGRGLQWSPYPREQRHTTVLGLVRSQPRPITLEWLPADFLEVLGLLCDDVVSCSPVTLFFESVLVDGNGTVMTYAPNAPSSFSHLQRIWKGIVGERVSSSRQGWDRKNERGVSLFQIKYGTYMAFSTIGQLVATKTQTTAGSGGEKELLFRWRSHLEIPISDLGMVHYASRTLSDVRGEVVLPLEGRSPQEHRFVRLEGLRLSRGSGRV